MSKNSRTRWLVLLLLLLAFLLRVYRLGAQSLWYDEGVSAYLTTLSPAELTRWTAEDIQPPLYYYVLYLWVRGAGRSEFALRFPSLFFGVLMVPMFYLLGKRLAGEKAAIIAALLAAISPLYLWYSQEARMYTLFTFLGLLSCWLLLKLANPGSQPAGGFTSLAYLLTNVAALYTHYFAFFLLAFQGLFSLITGLANAGKSPQGRHRLLGILALQGASVLAYAPWLPFLLNRYRVDVSYWEGTLKLHEALRKVLISFSLGETMLEQKALPLALIYGGLFLLSLTLMAVAHKRHSVLFLALYLFIPLVAVLALTYRNPKFNPRYLMFASPAFLLTIAGGMGAMWELRPRFLFRGILAAMALFVAASAFQSDHNLYCDPAFTKADFRGVARYIKEHIGPNETVLLVSGHMYPVFAYYYGWEGWTPLPPLRIISTKDVLNFEVADSLNEALAGKEGVWVVLWQDEVVDPNGVVLKLLAENCRPMPVEASFWHVRLRHYRMPPGVRFSSSPSIEHPAEVNFGGLVKFLGYDLDGRKLTLYWQALKPLREDYKVTVNVLDEAGHIWGRADRRPAAYLYPTMRWRPGEVVFGEMELPLLPGTPPGEYRLSIGVYSEAAPQGLDVLDERGAPQGKRAFVGKVEVTELRELRPGENYPVEPAVNIPLTPEITLRGFRLTPGKLRPGDVLHIVMLWEATSIPRSDYQLILRLTDSQGGQVERSYPPAGESFPTSRWPQGGIVLGQYAFRIPPSTGAGKAAFSAVLIGPGGAAGKPVPIGEVEIAPVQRTFELPRPRVELDANFADFA
ncbi:MAG: hypothetical protein DRI61_10485, partial [Chloroflexi bacterium]